MDPANPLGGAAARPGTADAPGAKLAARPKGFAQRIRVALAATKWVREQCWRAIR
jgi:hypothetical protein